MKWNKTSEKLPEDCELVIGVRREKDGRYDVYSLEYRDREHLFLVKSTERFIRDFLYEDQVEAWISFEQFRKNYKIYQEGRVNGLA